VPTDILDACACGRPVEAAYQRHAAQAEYDALPESLRPIDGVATIAVRCCGDCHPGPICSHPDTSPAPCPVCHAQPGAACTRPDGSPRPVEHRKRADAQPEIDVCRHHHRETCTDPRQCRCTGDDQPPARAPRLILPPTQHAVLADLGMPPGLLLHAAEWAARQGIDLARVRGRFRTGLTQDNRPALLFDYAEAADDGHGHEVVRLRIEPIEG
jgi:hypothetical protein